MTPFVLIPARMASGRLPGKPLADIGGKPMIVHVAERAREADIGRVVVATDTAEIADVCAGYAIETVMTRADHPSGSDRIHEALVRLDPDGKAQIIVNLQGDLPTIAADTVRAVVKPLENKAADIATLCCKIVAEEERTDPNVVKVIGTPVSPGILRALYFTRSTAPYGEGPLYHHIGIYAYRRESLDRFVTASPTPLEQRERLEQLRALEIGLRIDAAVVQAIPLGVDTPDQLQRAREMLGGTKP